MRLSSTRACVERLAGSYDGQSPEHTAHLALPAGTAARGTPTLRPGELLVTATSMLRRYALRCSAAPKPAP
jgi:hypothetical protein